MDSRSTFLHLSQGFKRMCSRRTVERVNGYPAAVPKPTQVGGYKHTKARGRNLVKELGNMAP